MNTIARLSFFSSLLVLTGDCKKDNTDTRDRVTGTYRLAGSAHYVTDAPNPGGLHDEYDKPDSGTVKITKVNSADSSGWVRISGLSFESNVAVLYFDKAGIPVAAMYSDSLITIPFSMPVSGSSTSIQGTITFDQSILKINYYCFYRYIGKTGALTSY